MRNARRGGGRTGRLRHGLAAVIGAAWAPVIGLDAVRAADYSVLNVTPTAISTPGAAAGPTLIPGGLVESWLAMVTQTQAAQPHWITPLVTVTPRLEQEIRYDYYLTNQANGSRVVDIGAGKGPEFIPTYDTEISLGLPPAEQDTSAKGATASGFGDWPAMLLKYRLVSANEEQGNYIATAFIQAYAPTGTDTLSNDVYVVQPTLAVGKGWGDFDVQATFSQQYAVSSVGPPGSLQNFGNPVLINATFQYHIFEYLWPEFEVNYTYWPGGIHRDLSQVLVMPGIIFGRFPLGGRYNLIVGAGYQFAVTEHPVTSSNWVLTSRITF